MLNLEKKMWAETLQKLDAKLEEIQFAIDHYKHSAPKNAQGEIWPPSLPEFCDVLKLAKASTHPVREAKSWTSNEKRIFELREALRATKDLFAEFKDEQPNAVSHLPEAILKIEKELRELESLTWHNGDVSRMSLRAHRVDIDG